MFHFVTGGIHAALDRAREAAGGRDMRIGGGVSTVRQYLQARLIDELHLAVRPGVVRRAARTSFRDLDLRALGYQVRRRPSRANARRTCSCDARSRSL